MFFSPFANIWPHAFPEALIAESLAERGADITVVRCGRYMQSYCVAMSAAGLAPTDSAEKRARVCTGCEKRARLIDREVGLPSLLIDDWIRSEDRARVEDLVAEVTGTDWTELEVDGHPLGRFAGYELWLTEKLVDGDLDDRLFARYRDQLRNTLLTYFGAKRLLAEGPKPDVVIVYNDHYSAPHAFVVAAADAGVPTWTLQGGAHIQRKLESMTMLRSEVTLEDVFRSPAWQRARHTPIDRAGVGLVGEHFAGLLQAASAFAYSSGFAGSSPAELRTRLGIADGRRVLLAAMSSEDELLAMRLIGRLPDTSVSESLFGDQFEWIEAVYRYAAAHPDVHVVVRPHPRMFPNKREQVRAGAVNRIELLQAEAPANVTYNLPADAIGLYDLMQIVDVLLNYRSTTGAELAAFGIPVVSPANRDFFTYPAELHRVGRTAEEFDRHITAALAEGWSIEQARAAFRWFAFLFDRIAVDMSDGVHDRPIAFRPKQPGRLLRLYNWAAFVFLQYGPLVRERAALRGRRMSAQSGDVFDDVITHDLASASDSSRWPESYATIADETAAISDYLWRTADELWRDVTEPGSLAERIRRGVAAARSR